MSEATLYECVLRHKRMMPVRHSFRYRTYLWFVDLDELPALPKGLRYLGCFRARDHFDGTGDTIRAGADRFLASHGIDLAGGRVFMLSHARVFGYVFNPLTLFWCYPADGSAAYVVAEVHNTFGGRHCYLLRPDQAGRATTAKEFYVSPFLPPGGTYRLCVSKPDGQLTVTVTFQCANRSLFAAHLRGTAHPVTARTLVRMALRHPWETAAVTLRIRLQGIRLFLRGLPVHPHPQKGVSSART